MRKWLRPFSAIVFCAYALPASGGDATSLADLLMASHEQRRPIPLVSQRGPVLSVSQAYVVQRAFVQRRLAEVSGTAMVLSAHEANRLEADLNAHRAAAEWECGTKDEFRKAVDATLSLEADGESVLRSFLPADALKEVE